MIIQSTGRTPGRARPTGTGRRPLGLLAVAAMVAGLVAGPGAAPATGGERPLLTTVEPGEEVHGGPRALAVNLREHLAHGEIATGDDVTAPTTVDPRSIRLARAWIELGHFSDAYETHLLGQSSCAGGTPVLPGRKPSAER